MIRDMLLERPPDGEEVWWWDAREDAWRIGHSMLMDTEAGDFEDKWPYWAPLEDIPDPEQFKENQNE